MQLMQKLIFTVLILLMSACIIRPSPSTQDKFIVAAGIFNILVKKVHAPQWRIGYNFLFGCEAAFKPKEDELKAEVSKSLRVWLQPLRELYPDKVFTDDFLFIRQPDMKACFDNREARQQVDTRITFGCKMGITGVLLSGVVAPDVCMRTGNVINARFLAALNHELGHAFGMDDTYVLGTQPSTGGISTTIGKQPSSIMSALMGVVRPRQHPYIKEDDKNGIIWLYKYYHEDHPVDDCFFPDYVPAPANLKTKRACEPRYPLIFEVKHGSLDNVTTILHDDPNLELNAYDSAGNTALHYAVQRGQIKVVEALLAQAGIKVNVLNKERRTPAQLARRLKNPHLAKLIEAHPSAGHHPIAWSVEAKGKKPVTWGELKRDR